MIVNYSSILCFVLLVSGVKAFCPGTRTPYRTTIVSTELLARKVIESGSLSRKDLRDYYVGNTSFVTGVLVSTLLLPFESADARGRATLEYSCDRYYPRIEAGGEFYANDLKRAIERNDWAAIKAATEEPPPKTKADKSKIDGGISERAAQAGGFSKARVIAAADLWAASFSDSSISTKTKRMKEQTAILTQVVDEMNTTAKIALGEMKPNGGIFGIGAKTPSQNELAKQMRELYIKGGNAWNQYVFLSNDDLPIQLKRLPYL